MVIESGAAVRIACHTLVADAAAPVLERLDPPRRAAVVMALLALVLTGLVLITCVMLGAHWVRRLARHKPGEGRNAGAANHLVQNRRMRDALGSMLPPAKTGDTVQMDGTTKDTKVDR